MIIIYNKKKKNKGARYTYTNPYVVFRQINKIHLYMDIGILVVHVCLVRNEKKNNNKIK